MPMPPTCREPALIRAPPMRSRAVQGRLYRQLCRSAPARTNVRLYGDDNPLDAPGFEAKVKLLAEIDAYARAKDPRVRQVIGEPRRHPGRWSRSCAPTARSIATSARWCGSMFRSSPATATGRKPAATAMAGARAMRASSRPTAWRDAVDEARAPGAGQSRSRSRRRPARWTSCSAPGWPGVMLHEAVGHGLEGDFNRKKTSAFAGLMGQQVAAKGVTVVDDGTIAVAARLALDRRRGHADQPHRADRGRHPGRLHAGPAERAADGHEADRQRPARKLCPCADAAHDQHLHAGGRPRSRRDHRVGEERHLRGRISAAARSTSPRANTCSSAPRPTRSRTARSARR